MNSDARISVALPTHPKTKRLIKRLGGDAAWRLVCLFLWAAANRADGDLSGMTSEDIELAVDWAGADGALVGALVDVGFLDGQAGGFRIHDWAEHNPYAAGHRLRSLRSRFAVLVRDNGRERAIEMMREIDASYVRDHLLDNDGCPDDGDRPSPLPSPLPLPSPSPSPKEKEPPTAAAPESPKDFLWKTGREFLVSKDVKPDRAGSIVGQLISELGDAEAANVMRAAIAENTGAPIDFLRKASANRQARPKVVPLNAKITGKDFGTGSSDAALEAFFNG